MHTADDRYVNSLFHSPFLRSIVTRCLFVAAACVVEGNAWGLQIEGMASRIIDGRTFTFVDAQKNEHVVVLMGVETPLPGQRKYWDATRRLGLFLRKRRVLIDWYRLESRCSRKPSKDCGKIAKVLRLPDGMDPALQMLQRGLAWHNPSTLNDQSTTDRRLYQEAEQIAQFKRLGVWSSLKPEPPWEYRKRVGVRLPSESAANTDDKPKVRVPAARPKAPAKKPKKSKSVDKSAV